MLNRHRPSPSPWHHAVLAAALVVGAVWVVLCTLPNDVQAQNQNRFRKPGESPWLFAGNIGVPSFDFEDTNIDWDLASGYYGDNFIVGFDIGMGLTERVEGRVTTTTDSALMRFVIGGRIGASDTFRHGILLESQLELASVSYFIEDPDGFGFDTNSTDNDTYRQALVYGYYAPDDPKTSWALFAGVGFALEGTAYDDTRTGEFTSNDSDAVFLLVRGEGQHVWVPGWVTVTGRSELRIYSASRATFDIDEGLFFEDSNGVALDTRSVLKVDNLDLFDLHPMAYAELNLDVNSGPSGTSLSATPVIGIGIIR